MTKWQNVLLWDKCIGFIKKKREEISKDLPKGDVNVKPERAKLGEDTFNKANGIADQCPHQQECTDLKTHVNNEEGKLNEIK
jgi:hypothetical protein